MGVFKFRLSPPDLAARRPDLRKAYVTGPDRTPARGQVDLRSGLLAIHREAGESARTFAPWPVAGCGLPFVGTATLPERAIPHELNIELARGRLNDVRNQLADWRMMGLTVPAALEAKMSEAQRAFARAATLRDQPEAAAVASQETIDAATAAGLMLVETYTAQVLQKRLEHAPTLPTALALGLDGDPRKASWEALAAETFNTARIRCSWAAIAPDEGRQRWDEPDAQLAWARKRKLAIEAGPLIEFRPGALPNWLYLWEGDYEELQSQAVELVRQAVGRYRGKIGVWHLVHRPAEYPILGLSEEGQIRLTAKLLQTARQVDPQALYVVDFDRPWAEWMSSSPFQLGPLHLADSLARAELGMAGIGLEVAPGYSGPGSHMRDLFEFSRLLDLFALVNLPLYISFAFPSSSAPDPQADESAPLELAQWPFPPNESLQRDWASKWIALAAAKPFVRSVTWLQAGDSSPHLYPHAGLFRPDGTPKPLAGWMKEFREGYLT